MVKIILLLTCPVQYTASDHMWLFKSHVKLHKVLFLLNTTHVPSVQHYMRLMATILVSTDIEHLCHHRKFYCCTALNSSCYLLRRPLTSLYYLTNTICNNYLQNNKNFNKNRRFSPPRRIKDQ